MFASKFIKCSSSLMYTFSTTSWLWFFSSWCSNTLSLFSICVLFFNSSNGIPSTKLISISTFSGLFSFPNIILNRPSQPNCKYLFSFVFCSSSINIITLSLRNIWARLIPLNHYIRKRVWAQMRFFENLLIFLCSFLISA